MAPKLRNKSAFAALTLVLVFALFLAVFFMLRGPQLLVEKAIGKTERQIDLTALVTQIRELSRLETASMRVMHVSTVTQSYGAVPNQLLGDELTFLAVGDVIAGVDLSMIREQDVKYAGEGELVLDLPPPIILVVRVDNQESRVINRDTGVLRRPDTHLETRVRARAEAGIRNEATRKGILSLAEQNAEKKVAEFLNKVGFAKVRFQHRIASPQL